MPFVQAVRTNRWNFLLLLLLVSLTYASVIPDMVLQWKDDANYSHGFLVPLIAGYFLYLRRNELADATVEPWGPGLAVIVAGLLQLVAGRLAGEFFTMRLSLVVVLAGIVLFLLGKGVFRFILLPLAYLLFMIPLPYILYDAVAFPLKLLVTRVSVKALQFLEITVLREGNILMFPSVTLEVADACSGVRSLVSLLAISTACAFLIDLSPLRRAILVASAVPIALATNAFRVIITGILAQYWGKAAAEGFFHEFAGMSVFAMALVLVAAVTALLRRTAR